MWIMSISEKVIYPNSLKNWSSDKEALRNFRPERETIVREQGSSEDGNFEAKPTPSETNSSSCLGIAQSFRLTCLQAAPQLGKAPKGKKTAPIRIIEEYLFPKTEGWITEWTGPHGHDVIADALSRAVSAIGTELKFKQIQLVVQYLQKSDIFGLAKLEEVAGGKAALERLIGKYAPEKPLPLEVDDVMQTAFTDYYISWQRDRYYFAIWRPFAQLWYPLSTAWKVTEYFSFYWCPKGVTANIVEELANKQGMTKFLNDDTQEVLKLFGNSSTASDGWIQFPNGMPGTNKNVSEQRNDVEFWAPDGVVFPSLSEVVFCGYMNYACTGTRMMRSYEKEVSEGLGHPGNVTRCKEQLEFASADKLHGPVCVGEWDDKGLRIGFDTGWSRTPEIGCAYLRRYN